MSKLPAKTHRSPSSSTPNPSPIEFEITPTHQTQKERRVEVSRSISYGRFRESIAIEPGSPTSARFSTDRIPPNSSQNSYSSSDDDEAAVDPHVIPNDDGVPDGGDDDDEEGEDLYNDNYMESVPSKQTLIFVLSPLDQSACD